VKELSNEVHKRIVGFCKKGDKLAEEADYPAALTQYRAAWDLLPEPRTEWEAATWILGAIGDASYLSGDHAAARDSLAMAMKCPDGLGNPFLHLRLGQCLHELGQLDQAADELAKAYAGAGAEIFEGEEQHLAFLKARMKR
jgi:tetratricopeptide (TPR) repeat protein